MSLSELSGSYTIDPSHSTIGFVARHAMITKVRGSFTDFTGTASGQGDQPDSVKVSVTIQVASISTGNKDRDGHLLSGDFFDAETYPTITFETTSSAIDGDTLTLTGPLTIKDVSRPVTIAFEYTGAATDPFGNNRVGFEGSTKINRSDFGLTWNAALEAGGVLVSDQVTLEFDVSLIKN